MLNVCAYFEPNRLEDTRLEHEAFKTDKKWITAKY